MAPQEWHWAEPAGGTADLKQLAEFVGAILVTGAVLGLLTAMGFLFFI